ncbi:MAG: patatin family protein [Bariatricus sp.]|nr:patatin family protein [Bariatricus sp.]
MNAMVLEGGTFRPIFSCGVMDALLDHDINFDYVIGVSAGITDGVSYVSKQKERNYNILMNYRHDKRYVGLRNYLTDRSLFGLKFAYETIPKEIYPFDWETYQNSPTEIRVGVTNIETGEAEYLDGKELEETCSMLKATCAIPFVFPPIEINGKKYYDGGICDPIPVRKAEADGHGKMLIVLTRPKGYIKTLSKANVQAAKMLRKKYPKLVGPLMTRHILYNETVAYCEQLEREGRAVLLRPTKEIQIDSFEKDLEKIDKIYRYGYELAVENLDKIKEICFSQK